MTLEQPDPIEENKNHTYMGYVIPWYVRLIWILFWIFVIYYGLTYFLPAMENELLAPN